MNKKDPMANEPTPIRSNDEAEEEVVLDENGNAPEEVVEPPPPSQPSTIGDDVYSMSALVNETAKSLRMKPEVVFKVLELALNYKLAVRQMQGPSPFPPGFNPTPETDEQETPDGE